MAGAAAGKTTPLPSPDPPLPHPSRRSRGRGLSDRTFNFSKAPNLCKTTNQRPQRSLIRINPGGGLRPVNPADTPRPRPPTACAAAWISSSGVPACPSTHVNDSGSVRLTKWCSVWRVTFQPRTLSCGHEHRWVLRVVREGLCSPLINAATPPSSPSREGVIVQISVCQCSGKTLVITFSCSEGQETRGY